MSDQGEKTPRDAAGDEPRDESDDVEVEDLELEDEEGVTERVRGGRMRATSIP